MDGFSRNPLDRVDELIAAYAAPTAGAAHLLCDRHDPDAVAYAVVGPDLLSADLTFGELRGESERLAASLQSLGLGPGDRIATLMGRSREYLVAVMAIWRLGAVHVPLFTAFASPAIAFRLSAGPCKLVFCDAAQRPKLGRGEPFPQDPPWRVVTTGPADAEALSFDDLLEAGAEGFPAVALGGSAPLIQIYTSGTTGKPKGVIVPIRALASFLAYFEFGLDVRSQDLYWNAADPGWAYGLYYSVLAPLAAGARSLMFKSGFSPGATMAVLERYRVTNFAAAPTVYRALRASGLGPNERLRLRCASSAGEPLTPEVNDWSQKVLGVRVHDHYGQTETGMLINNHHHPDLARPLKPGSMGRAMPGWTAAVLRPQGLKPTRGEMGVVAIDLARSPLAWFTGYVDDPDKSQEKFTFDGRWYFTGDMGRTDGDGYFYFAGRDDDVIIMAGYRISPLEVETVILGHPAVAECAVVAAPDEVRGEVLEAVVVLKPDIRPSDALTVEIQDRVKRGYAAHAYPRRVHYVEELPKTPSGKIQRFLLREQLSKS